MKKKNIPASSPNGHYWEYQVDAPDRLMSFLAAQMTGVSRTKLKSLLTKQAVSVNGKVQTHYDYALMPGMTVRVSREPNVGKLPSPLLKLVYEDDWIIVVKKSPGLLSVGTERERHRTVQAVLNEYFRRCRSRAKAYVVHRLDRDTSGLMMFAKDEQTQHILRDNWHDLIFDRRYVAVVIGSVEREGGTVRSWLTDRILYVYSSPVDDGGKEAITHYRVLNRGNGYTLMELRLETGRKNQIRVHMQDIGHPVVGDGRYGSSDNNPLRRLALHAFRLWFTHPVTKEVLRFDTEFPSEFVKLVGSK